MPERKLDNWLATYMDYVAGTESPTIYHKWVGLGVLAAAAQRKIYLKTGKLTIHSNMLLVLVGPSGGPRKTTALDFGEGIVRAAMELGAPFELAPRKASSAALLSRMARIENKEHQSITAFASELGTLLGANSVDVSDVLTDLWDCKAHFDKETIGRGIEKITAPWVNILAATTPVWLADNLPKTASEGGFVSRGMFVYAEENETWVAIPEETPEQERMAKDLAFDLAMIVERKGIFQFSHTGRKYYEDWYLDRKNFVPKYDNRMTTFYQRKHVHVEKAAMMLSLSQSDSLVLEVDHIINAISLVEEVEKQMSMAFHGVGRNLVSMDHERIKRQIQLAGRLPYKQILNKNIHQIDKLQIDIILGTLKEQGLIIWDGAVVIDAHLTEVKK